MARGTRPAFATLLIGKFSPHRAVVGKCGNRPVRGAHERLRGKLHLAFARQEGLSDQSGAEGSHWPCRPDLTL